MPVIGIMGPASARSYATQVTAIRQGLRETGFVEGQNLAIETRWVEDQFERLPALAADLVRRQVALIITAVVPQPRLRQGGDQQNSNRILARF